ncbi:MAG: hypothetical protein RL172_3261, partial [Bacteroidota bacterium]
MPAEVAVVAKVLRFKADIKTITDKGRLTFVILPFLISFFVGTFA